VVIIMADNDQVDESIETLKAKLEEERNARLEAEGRASAAETRADRSAQAAGNAGNEIQRNRLQVLDSSIDQIKTNRDILRDRLRNASAEGDHDAVAEITMEMSDVGARLLSLENGKAQLQHQIENPPAPAQDTRPFNSLSMKERVDRIANGLSPLSAAWVRSHPEWAQSEANVNALVGAHNAALARGKIADTPDYFSDIERMLEVTTAPPRNGADTEDNGALSAAAIKQRDTPPPAAPPRGGGGGRIRTLSPLEREAAKIAGQTDQEYADAQDALVKEGRITRH
jgi:hypothetical protein